LYTTPVIYVFFDRIRLRIKGKEHDTLPSANGSLPEAAG
jgi:hypothetical protein